MSRSNVKCAMQHTPLAPYKNRIRRDWMGKVPRTRDIITISHGLLDVASVMRWQGLIQICDIDPGVRETAEYARADYPDLRIPACGESIQTTVADYCATNGVKKLGAVDVDLACTMVPAWGILENVLLTLAEHKYRGRVLLTVSFRSDGFKSMAERIQWLSNRLPKPFRYVNYTVYRSGRVAADGSRSIGSAMCIIELTSSSSGPKSQTVKTLAERILAIVQAQPQTNIRGICNALKASGQGENGRAYVETQNMLRDGKLARVNGMIQTRSVAARSVAARTATVN